MLVTGDRADIADMVGRIVGVDAVLADCDPADKLAAIERESANGATIMVGDGVNDAPALAAAGVGVALAARGATASSEAADVVLTVDRIDALADAILIARRSKRIALQAVVVGMGLSLVAMVAAAVGLLPPAAGAILQEVIDVLAIAIALRAVLPGTGPHHRDARRPTSRSLTAACRARRRPAGRRADPGRGRRALDARQRPRPVATPCSAGWRTNCCRTSAPTRSCSSRWSPGRSGGTDATAALSRTHAEIEHQVGRLHRLLADLDDDTAQPEDVVELRRLLYGLYAVLRLHNAQEEEGAFSLVPDGAASHTGVTAHGPGGPRPQPSFTTKFSSGGDPHVGSIEEGRHRCHRIPGNRNPRTSGRSRTAG